MSNNIYNILGKLNALAPKTETPKTVEQKPIYESVEARGSVLEGIAQVESRLARMFAEEKANEDMLAKKDYDGDGKKESPGDEYKGSKDKAIKKAMDKKELDEETHGQYLAQKEKEAQSSGKSSFQAFKQTHPVDGKPGVEEEVEDTEEETEEEISEGFADLEKYMADKKGTGKFDKKKTSTGTTYTRKSDSFIDDNTEKSKTANDSSDGPKKKGRPKKDKFAESTSSTGSMLVESALDKIAHQYSKEVKDFMASGDLDDDLFSALYDYYFDDMPYGTKKARDGDPYEWVAGRFHQDMNMRGLREAEAAPPPPMEPVARNMATIKQQAQQAQQAGVTPEKAGAAFGAELTVPGQDAGAAPAAAAPAPVAESGAFIPGRTVYWRGKQGEVDRVEGNKCFVIKPNGEMDVWPTRECSTEKQGTMDTLKGDIKGIGQGIKNFVMNKPDPMDEELNELAKLAGLSEAKKCNHTMEGKKCPVHGLKECGGGMYESAKPDYIDLDKDGDKEESMKDAADDAEQVDEAGDFIKGIKRFVKGKDSPQDVLDKRLGKVSSANDLDSLGKEASRYAKVQKVVDKSEVDEDGDFIKGIKRFVKGKQNPFDVRDEHLSKMVNARERGDQAAHDKEGARYDKIQSIIDRQNVAECGPGPMSNMGQDEGNMSINTSMNSDGTKSVSVSATGNQADALAQMLKMAGLAAHHAVHGGEQEPQAVVIQAGPEEQVEEERDVQYANTPDEEVENVDAIMHQGNDLNREKEQYAGMAKAGDNPMATRESIEMPARISRMLAGVKQAKW